jgi:c(7)-type cytochrome triheme protein
MRYSFAALAAVCLFLAGCSSSVTSTESTQPQPAKPAEAPPSQSNADAKPVAASGSPPETIEFYSSRDGNVIFTHKKHYERVNGDCTTCHTKIFPQSREAINYGKALHRAAEAKRTACAACHAVGGTAFAADSNCPKCHLMRPRH